MIARAIKKRKIAKKEEPVRELIFHWNLVRLLLVCAPGSCIVMVSRL